MTRRLSAATCQRFALAERCLQVAWKMQAPLDTIGALTDGAFLVELRPVEFARFALAVASVRWQQRQTVRS